MGRTLYIVARDHPELFSYLYQAFARDGEVDVILDRRVAERRRTSAPYPAERRRADRRSRPELDSELEFRAHVSITLPGSPR